MKIKQIIGIDVSKLYLDIYLHGIKQGNRFENSPDGIALMFSWVEKITHLEKSALFYVLEHTGLYSYELAMALCQHSFSFTLVSGLAVKRSLGIVRGKDDRIDACRLAQYGYRLREELSPYRMPEKAIRTLKSLLKLRDRLVKQRSGYKACLKEQKRVLDPLDHQCIFEVQHQMIKTLTRQIKKVEKQLEAIIKAEQELNQLYQLICSVKGVGPQTAWHFIVFTAGFIRFKSWRAFAAYAGTAPFPHRSGSSIRGKTKVSHLANKKIKSLLDLCAKSAIQHDPQLKAYYQRKIQQGKAKMTVINAVRNKIIARIFAVVNRQTPFVDTHKFAA